MKVIVLGSGIIGVTTAYNLYKSGHEVTVIDRRSTSGEECSFANGGQLSYSHAEPLASPNILPQIPKWLISKNSPFKLNLTSDLSMWKWISQFLLNCNNKKARYNTQNIIRLSSYSMNCLRKIEQEIEIDYKKSKGGILHYFDDKKALEYNIRQANFQNTLGCEFEILHGREACIQKETALRYSTKNIEGGIFFPIDECGDANQFTVNIAKILEQNGVKFEYNTNIKKFAKYNGKIQHVDTDKGSFKADSYVVAMGSYSTNILNELEVNIPVYPMKGYSLSVDILNDDAAPKIGITDQKNRLVFSRLGNTLRVAGTAELAGYDDNLTKKRIKALKIMAKENFPACGDFEKAKIWSGLRPSTPDGSPIIGKSPYKNLFLNTGHGTLGWTLSCASAKIICDLIEGKQPEISLSGLTIDRFL